MTIVRKGDRVAIECTDPAGQHGVQGTVVKVNYASESRYHIGVEPDAAPGEIHWHESACLDRIGAV